MRYLASILTIATLSFQALSPTENKELCYFRAWFHEHASVTRNSGYLIGEGGSFNLILFPIGKSDRMYYVSYLSPGPFIDLANRSAKQETKTDRYVMTCWTRKKETLTQAWQIEFKPTTKRTKPTGTLLRAAYTLVGSHELIAAHPAFTPVQKGIQWKKAAKDLIKKQSLAVFEFAQNDQQSSVGFVINVKGNLTEAENIDPYYRSAPNSFLPVTQAEHKLMRKVKK